MAKKNRKNGKARMRRAISVAMAAGVVGNVMALNVFAEGFNNVTVNDTVNTPNVDAVTNNDDIDNNAKAQLVIHKYDMTAALRGGVDIKALNTRDSNPQDDEYDRPDGTRDMEAETALAPYALANCEFSYLKVGDIATVSVPNGATTGGALQVVYGIPAQLASILGLDTSTAAGENNAKYVDSGKYYYTSSQLSRRLADVLDVQNTEYVDQNGALTPNGSPEKTTQKNTSGKNAIEDYLSTNGAQGSVVTNADGVAATSNTLPLGLYLVVETKTPQNVRSTVNPFFVSLPMTSKDGDKWQAKVNNVYITHVYPKNQTNDPTMDKTVHEESMATPTTYEDTATASAGDILDYRVVTRLPTITSKATHLTKYTFTDQMSKGLTYVGGENGFTISIYDNEDDARKGTGTPLAKFSQGEAFGVKITDMTDGGHQAVISLDANHKAALNEINKNGGNLARTQYSDKWLVLSYKAKVNSDDTLVLGDKGNINDIKLTYSRTNTVDHSLDSVTYPGDPSNPDDPGGNSNPGDPTNPNPGDPTNPNPGDPSNPGGPVEDTIEDEAIVYSYGINLKKTFEGADGNSHTPDATKVKFVLYNKTDKFYLTAVQEAPGKYHITGKANSRAEATEFSPAASGDLFVNGIEADTYTMTEVKTDTGYALLRDSIDIAISGTKVTLLPNRAAITGNPAPNANPAAQPAKPAAYTLDKKASAKVDNVATNMETMGEGDDATKTENARVMMSVLNSRGFRLPATGGKGIWVLSITGAIGLFGAVTVLTRKEKKVEE